MGEGFRERSNVKLTSMKLRRFLRGRINFPGQKIGSVLEVTVPFLSTIL